MRTTRWTTLVSCAAAIATLVVTATCSSPPTPPNTPQANPDLSVAPCTLKPAATNTGASGSLEESTTTVLQDGQTLENVRVASLDIPGRNVVVRNVEVAGKILVTGDNVTIDRVSMASMAISSASGTTVQYSNIGNSLEDAIHITSDSGRMIKNVVLSHNYIHTPRAPEEAHYDGTQVRGVRGIRISCSTYDPGPYQQTFNAAVFIEEANGGNKNVSVEHNWLYGFGFSIMLDSNGVRIVGNRVGGDIHWDACAVGPKANLASLENRDNFNENTNAPEAMCNAPGAQSR
jgi:hypothetical protein